MKLQRLHGILRQGDTFRGASGTMLLATPCHLYLTGAKAIGASAVPWRRIEMSRTLRTLSALVLTVLFLTSPVAAAALPGQAGAESFWSSAWEWLVNLLPNGPSGGGLRPSTGTNGDAGVGIDPDGVAVTGANSERSREVHQGR